ncbi:Pleiotropic regulator 1 [Echinococcus granulosus]|uniref:Pleiotropic regulator 1 n=1 Tax=Echinococcus granulosus TaxID=6210 RepID=U6JM78_ECHGR|nr:Pleiotropic regulator [Echinococcus granulosus]EUB59260.1 Pleiotropic regulator [Echinococcus granulosus]KAH9285368.1 Pleiotropic regulator 1 [Echinococcus granulosus]CDS23566.1 pleiotropic regulator 1 [Echinococcus granulosus]
MFEADQVRLPEIDEESHKIKVAVKRRDQYGSILNKPLEPVIYQKPQQSLPATATSNEIIPVEKPDDLSDLSQADTQLVQVGTDKLLLPKKAPTMPKPTWHPPWKLSRVISGHSGWVRCIAFDSTNEFFATGAADRMIKIWDFASGYLKLTLTGHISAVRGVVISPRQPYLFSCGEDKTVKCWDLEQNKVIRHYHGHMSAVYDIDLHPTLDVLVTCGRDATARVWDMRTKVNIHTLSGHSNTVSSVRCQESDPQVITASHDATIRLWDLAAGKTMVCLTNHKKSVRSLAIHPTQNAFISASPDNIKQWKLPNGTFLQNLSGHKALVNALAINMDGVVVSGGDNGSMYFWDWRSGYNFQKLSSIAQPGSINSEAGIFALAFDRSGSRLVTAEADKTIKVYKEDETATEETHPTNWRPGILRKAKY